MAKPFAVIFAGVPGSSKSIIAHFLSEQFSLPIFSTDNIRFEVKADLLVSDINEPRALQEYRLRRSERLNSLLERKSSFILDASVDRRWKGIKKQLLDSGYCWYLIDLELSKAFLTQLYSSTGKAVAIEALDAYLAQHQTFINRFSSDISIRITDETFAQRNIVCSQGLKKFLKSARQ